MFCVTEEMTHCNTVKKYVFLDGGKKFVNIYGGQGAQGLVTLLFLFGFGFGFGAAHRNTRHSPPQGSGSLVRRNQSPSHMAGTIACLHLRHKHFSASGPVSIAFLSAGRY